MGGSGARHVNTLWQMGRRRRHCQRPRGSWLLVAVVVIVSAYMCVCVCVRNTLSLCVSGACMCACVCITADRVTSAAAKF